MNLVPFIDLLSACIAFLLMTAVWTSLYRADASLAHPGSGPREELSPPADVTLGVLLEPAGAVIVSGAKREHLAAGASGQVDERELMAALGRLKAAHPDRRDLRVAVSAGVLFDALAEVLDAGHAAGFAELAVADAAGML